MSRFFLWQFRVMVWTVGVECCMLVAFVLATSVPDAKAQNFSILRSGDWNSPSIWQDGRVAPSGPGVMVSLSSHAGAISIVDLNGSSVRVGGLTVRNLVRGEIQDTQSDLIVARLLVDKLSAAAGGELKIGDTLRMEAPVLEVNTDGGAGSVVLGGVIQPGVQPGNRVVVAGGEVHFTGAHEYDGGTELRGGVVVVGNDQAFGDLTGPISISPGVTVRADSQSRVVPNPVVLTDSGVVSFGGTGAEKLFLEGGVSLGAGERTLRVLGEMEISGEITDGGPAPGRLIKAGDGILALSSSFGNPFAGGVELLAGTLQAVAPDVLGTGAAGVVIRGGRLEVAASQTIEALKIYGGNIVSDEMAPALIMVTGAGGILVDSNGTVSVGASLEAVKLTKQGAGTVVLNALNSFSGGTNLNSGVIEFQKGALGSGVVTFQGGTLRYGQENSEDLSPQIRGGTGPIRVDTNGNSVVWATTVDASNPGGLIKQGQGSLQVNGLGGATDVVVSGGELILAGGANLPSTALLPSASSSAVLVGSTTVLLKGSSLVPSVFSSRGDVTVTGRVEVDQGAVGTLGGMSGKLTLTGDVKIPAGAALVVGGNFDSGALVWGGVLQVPGSLSLTTGSLSVSAGATLRLTDPRTGPAITVTQASGPVNLQGVRLELPPQLLQQALNSSPGSFFGVIIEGAQILNAPTFNNPSAVFNFALTSGGSLQVVRRPYSEFLPRSQGGFASTMLAVAQSGQGTAAVRDALRTIDRMATVAEVAVHLTALDGGAAFGNVHGLVRRQAQAMGMPMDFHLEMLSLQPPDTDLDVNLGVRMKSASAKSVVPANISSSADPMQTQILVGGGKVWTVWAAGLGARGDVDATADHAGARWTMAGGALGAERQVGSFRYGIMGMFGDGSAAAEGQPFRVETQSGALGGYSLVQIGPVVLDASVLWARQSHNSERNVLGQSARADYISDDLAVGLGGAVHLTSKQSNWVLTPLMRLKFIHSVQEAFEEQGTALGIRSDAVDSNRWLGKLGLRIGRRGQVGKRLRLGIDGTAFWVHDFGAQSEDLKFSIGGMSYLTRSRGGNVDSIQMQMSAYANFGDAFALQLTGRQEMGSQNRISSGMLSFVVPF
jgi:outer membrane autotransporter protein